MPDRSASDTPLVSVIVRSTDRPSLPQALATIAAQDYPRIEIVVVGASGPAHPPLPERCGPHPLRFVRCGARRNRPEAANTGLDAATGDWITFLDDDDALLPDHVSGLMAARADAPEAGVVHCFARATFADGRTQRFGQPFAWCSSTRATSCTCRRPCSRARSWRAAAASTKRCSHHEDWDFFLQARAVRVVPFRAARRRSCGMRTRAARVPAAAPTRTTRSSPGIAISSTPNGRATAMR